jgi:hypothetical protein
MHPVNSLSLSLLWQFKPCYCFQGVLNVKSTNINSFFLFVKPPSMDELVSLTFMTITCDAVVDLILARTSTQGLKIIEEKELSLH